ncbi:hypothetical protein N9I10_01850 [Aquiluna sp.]|jgi:hypothetical protein|nr:hypothetical protein [Aquiluna sp.]MDA8927553.1 hypothetical protein [Aquiluna sp.]
MRQYSESEIEELLQTSAGDDAETAAAIAIVTQAIIESRRLGRIATKPPKTSWNRGDGQLRGQHIGNWASEFRG